MNMTIEEGIKLVVSGGIVTPEDVGDRQGKLAIDAPDDDDSEADQQRKGQ